MEKALFFDLDGTLWDAIDPLFDSWNEAMKKHNLPYRFNYEKMKSYMGLTPEETAVLAFPDVSLAKGIEYFNICLEEEIAYLKDNPGKLYPHEEKVLAELAKEYDLYVISNCGKGYIENYLFSLNMNKYFKDHVCIGDTGLEKWQNIQYFKKKYRITEVIYIGDTLKDKKESDKAGVRFIHAAYGFGLIKDKVYKINNLLELPAIVKEVFNKN